MIGIFAGRGDVLVGYILAAVIGAIGGYYLRKWQVGLIDWWLARKATKKG